MYRWADILLMKAEIKNALGQDPTTEMNQVMQRADATALFVNSSQSANDDVILNERLKELAFEGKAWWDLVRFGNGKRTINGWKKYFISNISKYN